MNGQKLYTILGYSFNADTFCLDCTIEWIENSNKESSDLMDNRGYDLTDVLEFVRDSEGNELHPVFLGDEQINYNIPCGNYELDIHEVIVKEPTGYDSGCIKEIEFRIGRTTTGSENGFYENLTGVDVEQTLQSYLTKTTEDLLEKGSYSHWINKITLQIWRVTTTTKTIRLSRVDKDSKFIHNKGYGYSLRKIVFDLIKDELY